MKTNTINEDSLFRILERNHVDMREFAKNPLMEKLEGKEDWIFEHRNIQEYFAKKSTFRTVFKKIKKYFSERNQ